MSESTGCARLTPSSSSELKNQGWTYVIFLQVMWQIYEKFHEIHVDFATESPTILQFHIAKYTSN